MKQNKKSKIVIEVDGVDHSCHWEKNNERSIGGPNPDSLYDQPIPAVHSSAKELLEFKDKKRRQKTKK